jgi:hypothetical protein
MPRKYFRIQDSRFQQGDFIGTSKKGDFDLLTISGCERDGIQGIPDLIIHFFERDCLFLAGIKPSPDQREA